MIEQTGKRLTTIYITTSPMGTSITSSGSAS
jgi:hypothetical protein